jgi:hypothetical protein
MSNAPNTSHRLLVDAPTAAESLSISPRLRWSMTASGDIPNIRLRRRALYDPRDLKAFIHQCKKGGDVR